MPGALADTTVLEPDWRMLTRALGKSDALPSHIASLQHADSNADRAKAYYLIGRELHRSKLPTEQEAAIYALETAHALHPRAAAYTELGIVLKARGTLDSAERFLRKAIHFTPQEPAAYIHLGMLASPSEGEKLLSMAIELQPTIGAAYVALASVLQRSGKHAAAQQVSEIAAKIRPSESMLRADWRHWHENFARAQDEIALTGGEGVGIGYEAHLQFPWSGLQLRAMAAAHVESAIRRLPPLPMHLRDNVGWPNRPLSRAPLRIGYIGALSDEPQMRAMSALFRGTSPSLATFLVEPTTAAPPDEPEYLRFFFDSLPAGSLPSTYPVSSPMALSERLAGSHILLDGLWRKECILGRGNEDGQKVGASLACVLLRRASPITLSVLAAPVTYGTHHVDYTLGDALCLPPRLAASFAERFVLLPAGGYPFSHAAWSNTTSLSNAVARSHEGLRGSHFVLASFVQRWKVNPMIWPVWMGILARLPGSVLWLLQHPLDRPTQDGFALTGMLRREMGVSHRRLTVMARQPLERHVSRTGLADLVLDTWPYTAHTTVADALWQRGAPWLALGASNGRMDSLLSSAAVHGVGASELQTTSFRAYEDFAVGCAQWHSP